MERVKTYCDGHVPGSYLEITLDNNGDIILNLYGKNVRGKPGEVSESSTKFFAEDRGGHYHETRRALLDLIEAIRKDNSSPFNFNNNYKNKVG